MSVGTVEVVELGVVRSSTWGTELEKIKRPQAVGKPAGQPYVVFGSTQGVSGFSDAVEKAGQTPANLPTYFLESLPKDLNGSFEYHETPSSDSKSKTTSNFKVKQMEKQGIRPYSWEQIVSFVRYDAHGNAIFVLCLDSPDSVRKVLKERLIAAKTSLSFEWHVIFLEVLRDRYDQSVWSLRDYVRNAELARESTQAKPDFVRLHEIARHLLHSNETLDVAVDTIERIIASYPRLLPSDTKHEPTLVRLRDRTSALEKDVQGIKRRSESLTQRLQNEIDLAYNLVAQRDNQIMVQMGERARQDNNNMKLIALVGLAYLPGSFVSSFFGMGFFSSDGENGQQTWQVSEKLWVYAAITVPLTLSTVIIWALANYRHVIRRGFRNSIQRKSRTNTNTVLLRTS